MTAEVDPLEALIKLAKADTGLNTVTGGRIDDRHHYGQDGGDWAQNDQALTIAPVGGPPDLYNGVWKGQYEARCYGDTYYEAGAVLKKLVDFTRANHRRTVAVTEGTSLVYFVVPRSQARQVLDDEGRPLGGMPAYQLILEAEVAELTVT